MNSPLTRASRFLLTLFLPVLAIALMSANAKASSSDPFRKVLRPCETKITRFLYDLTEKPPQNPPVITRNPEAIALPEEKKNAGICIGKHRALPKLKDGAYVFILDEHGNLCYSERVPNIHDYNTPLVSHRSLTSQMENTYQSRAKIVSAGEFYINFGEVSELNNKANTYHGNAEHLAFARKMLKRRGLDARETTLLVDYSRKQALAHWPERIEAHAKLSILNDPKATAFYERIQEVRKRIYKVYKDPVPGHINFNAFLGAKDLKLAGLPVSDEELRNQLMEWITLLKQSEDHRETYESFFSFLRRHGAHPTLTTREYPNSIEAMQALEGLKTQQAYQKLDYVIKHLESMEGAFAK